MAADEAEDGRLDAMSPEHGVPRYLTTFVGRVAELESIRSALAGARLVTLAGPGGCGKTRLASEVAGMGGMPWSDDVRWVDLAATSDPTGVIELAAAACGVLRAAGREALGSLARQVGEAPMLLCLDNCEHVIDAAAELAAGLLRSCSRLSVLATSRESLGVPGEVVWRVPSLTGDDAVALFRARAIMPAETDEVVSAVRSACARLDGIPLAVELAAAWSDVLSPQEILGGLDDRFPWLDRGPRGVAARHRTLAASMAWSHDLLDEADRVLFRRLGVFPGGFTITAAGSVAGDADLTDTAVLAGLGRLVRKSLVVADTRGPQTRYRMLESVRHYALSRLVAAGEYDRMRERHLDTFLAMARDSAPLLDEDQGAWHARMNSDYENLRAAIEFAFAGDLARGRLLAAELPFLWHRGIRGREGLALLREAVAEATDDGAALQARLLVGVALVADTTEPLLEYDAAQAALALARAAGDRRTGCLALILSAVGSFYTDLDAGWRLAEEALAESDEIGYRYVHDAALALMGIVMHLRDEHDRAVPLMERAVDGLLPRGDHGIASTTLGFLALSSLYTGDVHRARELAARAVAVAQPLADYHRVGSARSVLATVEGMAGDLGAAEAALSPVRPVVDGADDPPFVPGLARAIGHLHLWRGDAAGAVAWFDREAPEQDLTPDTYLSPQTLTALAWALREVGRRESATAACAAALDIATRLGLPRVTADALEQSAHLIEPDDPEKAEDLQHDALALRARHGLSLLCVPSLEALARLAVTAESFIEACRLLGACDRAREELGCLRLIPDEDVRALAAAGIGREAFDESLAAGRAMTLDEAVAYARRARGTRGRPSSGWTSLTPTELDVGRLAVSGLNNPEIGQRLFMSRATVKTHLSHIYAKLGVANRTELAALAATSTRRDLLFSAPTRSAAGQTPADPTGGAR